MSNQTIVLEINAKIEITIVNKSEPNENMFKTPERKTTSIIIPDAPKRKRVIKYPFDILSSDLE